MNYLSNSPYFEPSQPPIPDKTLPDKEIKQDKITKIVQKWIDLVSGDDMQLWYATDEIKNCKPVVLAAVKNYGMILVAASKELKSNRDIVLAAVNSNGEALRYANEELRNNREIVLAAVSNNGKALSCASEELKNDREIVLAAVKNNGEALYHASKELRNEKEMVLAAVNNNGRALEFAGKDLQNDKEIVLAAVKNNGAARQFTSEDLRDDIDVVLALVQGDGNALQSLSNVFQNDKEIVLGAVNNKGESLNFAGMELRKDKQVILAAVKNNGDALSFANEDLRNDKDLVLAAVKSKGNALKFASERLQNDQEVALAAIEKNPEALKYVKGSSEQLYAYIKIAAQFHGPNMLNFIRYSSIMDEEKLSEILTIACSDMHHDKQPKSEKKFETDLSNWKEKDNDDFEEFDEVNNDFGEIWLKPPAESLFADSDLIIFPSDYLGVMPINGIKASELAVMEKVYHEITQKLFTIKGSGDFKKEVLDCFKTLMTRPIGRELMKKLTNKDISLTITDGKNFSRYIPANYSGREAEIVLGAHPDYHFITKNPQMKRKLIIEQEHLQNTMTLAHELTHFLHHSRMILPPNINPHPLPPTINPHYHNLEEQRTITGWFGEKLPKYPETTEKESLELEEASQEKLFSLFHERIQDVRFDYINENTLRSEFLMDHRVDHMMTIVPENLILSPDETVPEKIVWYLMGIFNEGLEMQFAAFLSMNKDIDFAKMTTKNKEPFNTVLIKAILESDPPDPISIRNFFESYQKHKQQKS